MADNNPPVGFGIESQNNESFSPLMESVNQKSYTRPNVEVSDATPIEEPVIVPPTLGTSTTTVDEVELIDSQTPFLTTAR